MDPPCGAPDLELSCLHCFIFHQYPAGRPYIQLDGTLFALSRKPAWHTLAPININLWCMADSIPSKSNNADWPLILIDLTHRPGQILRDPPTRMGCQEQVCNSISDGDSSVILGSLVNTKYNCTLTKGFYYYYQCFSNFGQLTIILYYIYMIKYICNVT